MNELELRYHELSELKENSEKEENWQESCEKLSDYIDNLMINTNGNDIVCLSDDDVTKDELDWYFYNGQPSVCNDCEFETTGTNLFELLFNVCADFSTEGQDIRKIAILAGMKHAYKDHYGDWHFWN